jgi:hypothetical protein
MLQKPKVTELVQIDNEGLVSLLDCEVLIMCFNYFYAGTLVGVNDTYVKLANCHIVYETGAFTDKKYKDAQKIADEYYIQLSAIESFGKGVKLS